MKKSVLEKQVTDYIIANQNRYYRLAYSYVRNTEDALDVVKESIYKAMSSLDSLRNPAYFKTWFYKIVVHTALDCVRQRAKMMVVDDDVLSRNSQIVMDDYNDMDLSQALDGLPLKYRSIIILRYFEDLTIEQVAKVLNENVNTVKTRLYTALQKLRIELEVDDLSGGISHDK